MISGAASATATSQPEAAAARARAQERAVMKGVWAHPVHAKGAGGDTGRLHLFKKAEETSALKLVQ